MMFDIFMDYLSYLIAFFVGNALGVHKRFDAFAASKPYIDKAFVKCGYAIEWCVTVGTDLKDFIRIRWDEYQRKSPYNSVDRFHHSPSPQSDQESPTFVPTMVRKFEEQNKNE